jgi:radical SAM protein with 4Fe4S-binding SPASM domain
MFNEINIELTSRCNKKCVICPRWRDGKEKGDIPFSLLEKIEPQIEDNTIVHFHDNGEPLLYPYLKETFDLFWKKIRHFDTNGILLCERSAQLSSVDIISVSIIEKDIQAEEQMKIFKKYLSIKPERQVVIARCVGTIDRKRIQAIKETGVPVVRRVLHSYKGRTNYTKTTIKPEDFICRDFLNHPTIDYTGKFHICTKYDPNNKGVIGDVNYQTIKEIWYSHERRNLLLKHVEGKRSKIEFCKECEYYGYPNA